jgi:hypothetical protein
LERWLQLIASYTRGPVDNGVTPSPDRPDTHLDSLPLVILVATHPDTPFDADSARYRMRTPLSPWVQREVKALAAQFSGHLFITDFIIVQGADSGTTEMEELRNSLRRARDAWMTRRGGVLGACTPSLARMPEIRARHGMVVPKQVFVEELKLPEQLQACVSFNVADLVIKYGECCLRLNC